MHNPLETDGAFLRAGADDKGRLHTASDLFRREITRPVIAFLELNVTSVHVYRTSLNFDDERARRKKNR